jgi:hypothetical protein
VAPVFDGGAQQFLIDERTNHFRGSDYVHALVDGAWMVATVS